MSVWPEPFFRAAVAGLAADAVSALFPQPVRLWKARGPRIAMAGEAALVGVRWFNPSTAGCQVLGDVLGTLVEEDLVGAGMGVAVEPGQVFVRLRPRRLGAGVYAAVTGAA